MARGTTQSNSNPTGVPPSTDTQVASFTMNFGGTKPHDVFLIGQFTADWFNANGDSIVCSVKVDGNLQLDPQVNNLNGTGSTVVVASGIVSVQPGGRVFSLSAFSRAANLTVHHVSLTAIKLK